MTDYSKKILTLVLSALLLLPCVSCSESTENSDVPAAAETVANEPGSSEESATEEVEEDLINVLAASFTPELQAELGLDGYESHILLRDEASMWSNPDIVAEETTGDRLNDAVYNRNAWLTEKYGFTIKAEYSSGDGNELKTLVTSGDDVYDFAFPQARAAANMAQTGVMMDLTTVPYLDFDNPTWSKMFIDMLKIKGKLYYATGDISVNSFEAVRALLFNKQLAKNYNLSDPYSLVREGDWTLDNFNTMAVAAAQDLDGNGNRTAADQWGMADCKGRYCILLWLRRTSDGSQRRTAAGGCCWQ